jgi:hypothetical protein
MPRLSVAITTILADRDWWKKTLIGGAFWTSLLGWPIVEGFQLESIDNSQQGYPTPLPRWNLFGDKAILGIFSFVVDFFFFCFPILGGGFAFFCGTLAFGLFGTTEAAQIVAIVTLAPLALYLVSMWLLGVSAIAKFHYVEGGELAEVLSGAMIRRALGPETRRTFFRARLHSMPPYIIAVGLLILGFFLLGATLVGALVAVWLGLSALFFARLVTVQLYVSAMREIEREQFEARRRRYET